MLAFRLVAERGILLDGDNETALAVGVAAARIGPKHTSRYLQVEDLVAGVMSLLDSAVLEHRGCIVHCSEYIEIVRTHLNGYYLTNSNHVH